MSDGVGSPRGGGTGGQASRGGGDGSGSGAAPGSGGVGTASGARGQTSQLVVLSFSPISQTFQGQIQVEIVSSVAGGEIRYTTDRTLPSLVSTASATYAGSPLVLTATTEVRAQLFVAGEPVGAPAAAVYVARSVDVSQDLPLVVIDAYGRGPLGASDRSFVDAAFMVFGRDATGVVSPSAAPPAVATGAGIHVRGQSSAWFAKAPYRVELRDAAGDDVDLPLLGMPAESDWVLHGPFPDKALIRNAFVYGLGRDMGLAAPRFAFAELYLNVSARPLGAEDYMGVYLLVETIKNQKNRLNLQQLRPGETTMPAITGGYIFKFELLASAPPTLVCAGVAATCWQDLELVDPDPVAPEQQAYITGYIQAFHDALQGDGFADPATGYQVFIDVPSFVDFLIVNEIARSADAYVRSAYFHKDRNGKIVAGPLWDFDLTMDVGRFFENSNLDGWQHTQSTMRGGNNWFSRLTADPVFVEEVKMRWRQLRQGQGVLSEASIDARVARLTAGLASGAERNFARWPNLTVEWIGLFNTPTMSPWQAQVDNMRAWLRGRMAWLDSQWN